MTFIQFKTLFPGNWSELTYDFSEEGRYHCLDPNNYDGAQIRFYPNGYTYVIPNHHWYKKKIWLAYPNGAAGLEGANDFIEDLALVKKFYKKYFKLSNFI